MLELMIYVPTFMQCSVSSFLSFLWRQTSKHYCKHVPRKLHLYTQQRGYPQAWTSRLSSTRLENLLHILEGNLHSDMAQWTYGLLIRTLISENQGLEKSRSTSNLRKISGPANLDFFLGLHLEKKSQIYTINLKKIQVTNSKKIQVCRT